MTQKNNSTLRVALVHDYLREYGGAERVLEALHQLFPQAPVYTAFIDQRALGIHWQRFADWQLRTTWMAKIPLIRQLYSPLRVLADRAFASLDLSTFDVVISSSNAYMAKAVRVPQGRHFCYCHTPPRALYGYATMSDWRKHPVINFFGTLINHYMRIVDFKVAQQVDVFIANSQETQRRIEKFYRRQSQVIHPPIEVPTESQLKTYQQQARAAAAAPYFLYVNRLALSKHPELAVQACQQLDRRLKIVGSGKMEAVLKQQAGDKIEFLGQVSDDQLHSLYAGAEALLYPVEDEDFGMVPVEAMAHGVPVIAHRSGGPLETIIDGQTGVFFDQLTTSALVAAVKKFEQIKFDQVQIHRHARQFDRQVFLKRIKQLVTP